MTPSSWLRVGTLVVAVLTAACLEPDALTDGAGRQANGSPDAGPYEPPDAGASLVIESAVSIAGAVAVLGDAPPPTDREDSPKLTNYRGRDRESWSAGRASFDLFAESPAMIAGIYVHSGRGRRPLEGQSVR